MAIDLNHLATLNHAVDAQRVIANHSADLALDEQRLTVTSRELVETLGILEKAEVAAKRTCNGAIEVKVEQLREAVADLRKREDALTRIVATKKTQIEHFLAEGTPTNAELLAALKDYEEAAEVVSRL